VHAAQRGAELADRGSACGRIHEARDERAIGDELGDHRVARLVSRREWLASEPCHRTPISIAGRATIGTAMGTEAVRFLVAWMAGSINSRQLEVIDYLREVIDYLRGENRVLREQIVGRRLRVTDDQRRRLAVKGKIVGRRRLGEFAGLVMPETLLRWYRELIARSTMARHSDSRGVAFEAAVAPDMKHRGNQ